MKTKQLRAADDSHELMLSLLLSSVTPAQADAGACRTTGGRGQAGSAPTLTDHTAGVVCAPHVSFSLSGRACLAAGGGGFTGLFSPCGTVSVPNRSTGATCRFRGGGKGGTLLLSSLRFSGTRLIGPGHWFSGGPL